MIYRTLGRTGLKVSLVSYGTGGASRLGQRAGLSEREQDHLVHRCLDEGINFFDTSEAYGDSEVILGRALSGVPRDSYVVATKCKYLDRSGSLRTPQDIATSIENSLTRLKVDCVDIMQFHIFNSRHYFDVVEQHYPVLKKFQDQGKIRFIGFSEQFKVEPDHKGVVLALETHPELWDVVQLKYGILNQCAADRALPLALKHNVGIINMAAVRVKLVKPDLLREQVAEWKQQGLVCQDAVPDDDPLGWLVHGDVDSVISAGYKFAADHPAISTVLTGTASIAHLEANLRAMENPTLPEEDKRRLQDLFRHIAIYI
jgi:aryl-alcohol dehydrogenase-like predicted oxidoreductase